MAERTMPNGGELRRAVAAAVGVGLVLCALARPAAAWTPRPGLADDNDRLERPRSRLHRPFEDPVFAFANLGLGGGFQHEHGRAGYGGGFVLGPGTAANFFDPLFDWDSSLVLAADYQQVAEDASLLSADGVVRHYLADRESGSCRMRPFLGIGVGATEVRPPVADGGGRVRYWSLLLEAGQEWIIDDRYLVVCRGQFRRFAHDGHNFTGWTLRVAAGLPFAF